MVARSLSAALMTGRQIRKVSSSGASPLRICGRGWTMIADLGGRQGFITVQVLAGIYQTWHHSLDCARGVTSSV